MIPLTEKLLTFAQLVTYLAEVRGLQRTWATVHRWAITGIRGVRLEALEAGGRWHTSIEAVERFFQATTRVSRPAQRQPTARQRQQQEEGLKRCREMGLKV